MVSLQTLCQQHHIWYIRRIPSTKGSLAKKISRVFCALQCQTGIISHLLPRSAAQGDDTVFAVGARIARPPREAVFRDGKGVVQGRFLRRTQRPPCVKGPQEGAACGGCGDLKPPLGAQGARKGALPVAGQATAAVGQPLALADRNAGREGLVATRRCHGISHDGGDQSFRSLPVLCTPVSGPSPAVYNPSGAARHLPLHRGGFGSCVCRGRGGRAGSRTRDARPYGACVWQRPAANRAGGTGGRLMAGKKIPPANRGDSYQRILRSTD